MRAASYHGGGEGDVVDERRGQSGHPHDQDDGDGHALVLGNRLTEEITGDARQGPRYTHTHRHTHTVCTHSGMQTRICTDTYTLTTALNQVLIHGYGLGLH